MVHLSAQSSLHEVLLLSQLTKLHEERKRKGKEKGENLSDNKAMVISSGKVNRRVLLFDSGAMSEMCNCRSFVR